MPAIRVLLITTALQSVLALELTAKTQNGTFLGRHLPEFSQDLFLGIPYARAPRLRNPTPWNESWEGIRSAENNGPACYSTAPLDFLALEGVPGMSEECLTLNIIRPSFDTIPSGTKLPVGVWFHGGGFVVGYGAARTSNASYIVQASVAQGQPILMININYRLGFLGFPGSALAVSEGITNIGLKDQRQALRWIQENIAAFGGDPEKVTLWGQSAGGDSIALQMMAYGGDNGEKLFRGGILVSAALGIGNTYYGARSDAVQNYFTMLDETGCGEAEDGFECLRGVPIAKLFNASLAVTMFPSWWPMIDGDFITEAPILQLLAGKFPNDVSLLLGTNNDEGLTSAQKFGASIDTDEQLFERLQTMFPFAQPDTIEKIMAAYPIDAPSPPYSLPMTDNRFQEAMLAANLPCGKQYRRVAAILGDFAQISGRRTLARVFAERGMTAYTYRFDTTPTSIPIQDIIFKPGFADHSAEYAYFFRLPRDFEMFGINPSVANSSSHLELSEAISAKLISYIYSGNPNSLEVSAVPDWPKYSVDSPSNLVFNATESPDALSIHVEPDAWRQEGMALWERYPLELDMVGVEVLLPSLSILPESRL